MHSTIPHLQPTPPRTLQTDFGDLCGHAKPCFDCHSSIKGVKGHSASLKLRLLTHLFKRRASAMRRPPRVGRFAFVLRALARQALVRREHLLRFINRETALARPFCFWGLSMMPEMRWFKEIRVILELYLIQRMKWCSKAA